jgi:hypothetical protein
LASGCVAEHGLADCRRLNRQCWCYAEEGVLVDCYGVESCYAGDVDLLGLPLSVGIVEILLLIELCGKAAHDERC